jgi:hypothetical protein
VKVRRPKPYVCIDCDYAEHHRFQDTADIEAAAGTWLRCLAYSRAQEQDGVVKASWLRRTFADRFERVEELVRVGLLRTRADGDFEIHAYAPRNQTRAMLDEARMDARERMSALRRSRGESHRQGGPAAQDPPLDDELSAAAHARSNAPGGGHAGDPVRLNKQRTNTDVRGHVRPNVTSDVDGGDDVRPNNDRTSTRVQANMPSEADAEVSPTEDESSRSEGAASSLAPSLLPLRPSLPEMGAVENTSEHELLSVTADPSPELSPDLLPEDVRANIGRTNAFVRCRNIGRTNAFVPTSTSSSLSSSASSYSLDLHNVTEIQSSQEGGVQRGGAGSSGERDELPPSGTGRPPLPPSERRLSGPAWLVAFSEGISAHTGRPCTLGNQYLSTLERLVAHHAPHCDAPRACAWLRDDAKAFAAKWGDTVPPKGLTPDGLERWLNEGRRGPPQFGPKRILQLPPEEYDPGDFSDFGVKDDRPNRKKEAK